MMPVVVSTWWGREAWAAQCLASLDSDWHVHVVHGWELDAIRHGATLDCERFLLLQDSVQVLDPLALELALGDEGDPQLLPVGQSGFNGVYKPQRLRAVGMPAVDGKEHSIHLEAHWVAAYRPSGVVWPQLDDKTGIVREHLGRRNLVLDNGVIRKFKGTWR